MKHKWFAGLIPLMLAACSDADNAAPETGTVEKNKRPQSVFFDRLSAHCGKAYAGGLVSNDEADKDFAGKKMRIHFASCSNEKIKIPFHVEMKPGEWNRSRTWIISKTDGGLRLKHDHRHEDGTSDKVTMYGGDTAADVQGTEGRQQFPVDAESIAMFRENDLAASVTNIWAVEISGAKDEKPQYVYELRRENRHFRVEFDLSETAALPPFPWGWDR